MGRRKKASDEHPVVQFRTPKWLYPSLGRAAALWRVSVNEAARRMLILACAGLRPGHYDLVAKLATLLGDPTDFSAVTQQYLFTRLLSRPSVDEPDLSLPKDDAAAATLQEMIEKLEEKAASERGEKSSKRR